MFGPMNSINIGTIIRCKLFRQVLASLKMTTCNKPDFNRHALQLSAIVDKLRERKNHKSQSLKFMRTNKDIIQGLKLACSNAANI